MMKGIIKEAASWWAQNSLAKKQIELELAKSGANNDKFLRRSCMVFVFFPAVYAVFDAQKVIDYFAIIESLPKDYIDMIKYIVYMTYGGALFDKVIKVIRRKK